MFTGIVQLTGIVKKVTGQNGLLKIEIHAPEIAKAAKIGDSVAVDGACLTVTALGPTPASAADKQTFTVQAIPETLAHTIVKNYKNDTLVNLESPLKFGDKLHGHLVQGHVDFAGTVTKTGANTTITFPHAFAKYLALKGSVTVNGVSLTVSALDNGTFTVSLIPQTLAATNLGTLKQGQEVNVEVDLMARYMERLLENKAQETADNFLRERGAL